jgi:hypothetical protein
VCEILTLPAEAWAGTLIALCDEYPGHLAAHLEIADPADKTPVLNLFDGFRPSGTAIVEVDYFDLDYRSEFTATHETSFTVREPAVSRVHFFSERQAGRAPLRDVVDGLKSGYRGYAVVRPQTPGAIGRSLVTPFGQLNELHDPDGLHEHIRTAVREHLTVFGVPLVATGVPFMEQDGHLLRCVHVSAWICHYTATLRGLVPRRPTAEFHRAGDETGAYGRPYPSDGLCSTDLSIILRKLDLPPELIDDSALEQPREPTWYDSDELWNAFDAAMEDERRAIWVSHNLTATICRYLNSGIPCILSRDDQEHTQVVCGYLREEDLRPVDAQSTSNAEQARPTPDLPKGQLHSAVVSLLVQDDQKGPYERVPVADLARLVADASEPWSSLSVIVPLPRGLWLSGQKAERLGADIFAACVKRRHEALASWAAFHALTDDAGAMCAAELGPVLASVDSNRNSNLAIRSYASTGSDFKRGFAERLAGDAVAVRVCALTPMPKYVWVVEAIDRELRAQGGQAVRGTVVIDGSAVSVSGSFAELNLRMPLLVHLPGQISRMRPDVFDDAHWEPTLLQPYFSGRWHHARDWLLSAESTAARSKTASSLP